jgi:hypothetical protein
VALTSADKAFGIIAIERKCLTKETLASSERAVEARHAKGEAATLAELLLEQGIIEVKDRTLVEGIRAKHGRTCEKCEKITYLLPGEAAAKKPCEHCGGKLRGVAPAPPAAAAPAAAPGPAARPVAPPAGVKPITSRIVRSAHRSPPSDPAIEKKPVEPKTPEGTDRPVDDALEEAKKNERARKLRMAGAFGYEPPPATPPGGTAPADAPAEAAPDAPADAPITADDLGPVPKGPAVLPEKRALPDSAFAPPPEEMARIAVAGMPPKAPTFIPFTNYTDEAKLILTFPIRGSTLAIVTVGAVVGAILGFLPGFASIFILFYYQAYQVKVANHVTAGHTDAPDWPDVGEIVGLGFRLFLCNVACFLPAVVGAYLAANVAFSSGPSAPRFERIPGSNTVGDDADQLAGSGSKVVGNDVSDEEFADRNGNPYRLSQFKGRWVVLGLIDRDDSSDSAITRPLASPEVYDLDRLAQAVNEIKVVAVIIDPGERRFKALGLVNEGPTRLPEHEGDEETGERTHLPPNINPDPLHRRFETGGGELQRLEVIRATEFFMPEKFNKATSYPTVWIIDPSGKVRRVFDGGASDRKIYATWVDLKRGGSGSVKARSLPGEKPDSLNLLPSFGFMGLLVGVLYILGMFYHPMAFLMTVVFSNGGIGFNYPAGIGSILRTQRDYFHVVAVLIAAWLVTVVATMLVGDVLLLPTPNVVRVIGTEITKWWLLLYSLLVEAFALGRFYVRNQKELGWLS